ncbi:MAG: 23S rRNA (adenine(2503)-C(2))-methyltransferase RlmN, partial [Actinobacteria bacterium]|nr:23S rRNA (adenine(2503)-C(2))-methyltransferase RlmN [Actinomycetota bacterium]
MKASEFIPDVEKVLNSRGEPTYRLKQAYGALCSGLARDWEEATSLPMALRAALGEEAPAATLKLTHTSQATDGTRKYLFKAHDGHLIETVMIPEKDRRTVCISTQVGCPMACKFCATGLLGIKRNLKAREIAEQVFVAARDLAPERVTNVVVMGMGEPFLNYDETLLALKVLNDKDGFNLAARHIAVSTSGLVDRIRRFADEPEQFHLAISLHTPFQKERKEIMPVASRHQIPELMNAARYYVEKTRRKLFFEYTLLAGVNDQPRHVEALAELLDHPLYHLNLL